jgi:S-DNA-T family DNA segregation ATPase FtsK/SpoIIIE
MSKNLKRIGLDRIYKDRDWKLFKKTPVIPLGAETDTHSLIATLTDGINIITAGKTGSGQTTLIHCALINLLRNTKPKDLKLVLIGVKDKELRIYNKLPNLVFPVVNTQNKAEKAIDWCRKEIGRRYDTAISLVDGYKTNSSFRKKLDKVLPRLLIVIDGYHDMATGNTKYFLQRLCKIVDMGPTVNVHILVTNSRPLSKRIYPEKLINFFKLRIAFESPADTSRALIGKSSAEKLKQAGEMLFREFEVPFCSDGSLHGAPVNAKPNRLQGFYMSKEEIKKEIERFNK